MSDVKIEPGTTDDDDVFFRNMGQKVLVSVKPLDDVIFCTRIHQLSPTGRFVELSGNDVDIQCLGWKKRKDVKIHEVL